MNQLPKSCKLAIVAMLLAVLFVLSYFPSKVQAQVDTAPSRKYGFAYDLKTGEIWFYFEYDTTENTMLGGLGKWPEGFGAVDEYILFRDGKNERFGLGLYYLPDDHPLANPWVISPGEYRPPTLSADYIYYTFDLERMEYRKMSVEEFVQKYQDYPNMIEDSLKGINFRGFNENENKHVFSWWTYDCYFQTGSQVFDVVSLEDGTKLRIRVAGPENTTGFIKLEIPKEIVPSKPDVKVFVEYEKVDYTITENDRFFVIYAEYTHSDRTIDIGPFGVALPFIMTTTTKILLIVAGTIVAVAILVTILLLRRRRRI